MERQSSSSSSSRNSFGCMSAIFRLLSKHDKRSKFLTSGKEQQKETAHAQSPIEAYEQRLKAAKLPRSPTLPAEMRRSKSVEIPPHAHALVVARLMGLESSEEKRMKLLRALEQCDEELKSLQRITEVVNNRSVSVGDIGKSFQAVIHYFIPVIISSLPYLFWLLFMIVLLRFKFFFFGYYYCFSFLLYVYIYMR
ncbi:hypothetical protein REPUB_Repub06bG0103100 [Reevesia pubescens]